MVFRKGTCLYGPGRVYQWSLGRVHAYAMVQVGYTPDESRRAIMTGPSS